PAGVCRTPHSERPNVVPPRSAPGQRVLGNRSPARPPAALSWDAIRQVNRSDQPVPALGDRLDVGGRSSVIDQSLSPLSNCLSERTDATQSARPYPRQQFLPTYGLAGSPRQEDQDFHRLGLKPYALGAALQLVESR